MKKLVAKGSGSDFKPGFTWGGEYEVQHLSFSQGPAIRSRSKEPLHLGPVALLVAMVPSYRTGGFLDPKGRGLSLRQ
eukprot:6439220-Amphidinium_carterae.1